MAQGGITKNHNLGQKYCNLELFSTLYYQNAKDIYVWTEFLRSYRWGNIYPERLDRGTAWLQFGMETTHVYMEFIKVHSMKMAQNNRGYLSLK